MRLAVLALAFLAATAAALPGAPPVPVVLPGTEQFDLAAKGGPEYRVFVAAPKGKPPPAGFPVVYLTDGNGNFPVLHAAVRRQSAADLAAVVVGVGYPTDDPRAHAARRAYDLTSPASPEWMKTFPPGGPVDKTGGNDRLLAFIEDELKPLVEKRHPVDRTRQALFGHSLGGLFVLHALFAKPEAFQTYLASSPSVWWNDRSVLAEEKAFVAKFAGKRVAARLLVTVGEWERSGSPRASKEVAAAVAAQRMVDDAKGLAGRLEKAGVKGLSVAFREFAEEDHGSVLLPAAGRGVRYALDAP